MNSDNLVYKVAVWLIPLVVAIVFHEVAHGYAARAFGDPTAAERGRLTLNPIRHVDPVGTVVLPMLLAIASAPIFGWAKPVPVIAQRMRNPRLHMMLVALAGPVTNFVLALGTVMVIGALIAADNGASFAQQPGRFLADSLESFLLINIFLGVFNLIPLPPFDGGHVVEGLLPRALVPAWGQLARIAFPLLIVLLLVLPMISPDLNIVARLVGPIAEAVTRGYLSLIGVGA